MTRKDFKIDQTIAPRFEKRVLHLAPLLREERLITGGAERYVLELVRAMRRQADVRLVTYGPPVGEMELSGLPAIALKPNFHVKGAHNPFALSVYEQIRWADIVHVHQPHMLMGTLAVTMARALGKRVFATDLGGGGWDLSAYVSNERWFHGHLHISKYSAKLSQKNAPDRHHVIYGGVDTDKFSPASSSKRDAVVFVGRLLPHKGVNYLIEGIPKEVPLKVVGPVYEEKYFALLRDLAKGKNVEFLTDCSDADLVNHYQQAIAVVLPSVCDDVYGKHTDVPELLGQTLLEGMACGTPAICADTTSMPEIVVDQKTGFVVAPNSPQAIHDAVKQLSEHPARISALGQAGRQRVLEYFSWETVVKRCFEHYERS